MAEEQAVSPEKEFITLFEATQILGLSRKTIYNLMKTDQKNYVQPDARGREFSKAVLFGNHG